MCGVLMQQTEKIIETKISLEAILIQLAYARFFLCVQITLFCLPKTCIHSVETDFKIRWYWNFYSAISRLKKRDKLSFIVLRKNLLCASWYKSFTSPRTKQKTPAAIKFNLAFQGNHMRMTCREFFFTKSRILIWWNSSESTKQMWRQKSKLDMQKKIRAISSLKCVLKKKRFKCCKIYSQYSFLQ